MAEKMTKTLKKALIDQDKTVTELAVEIGKSRVHTSRIVNGYFKRPPLRTVKLIAKALHIRFEELDLDDRKRAA